MNIRSAFCTALLPVFLLSGLSSLSAVQAQNAYFVNDATIDATNSFTGVAYIGYGSASDYAARTNPASPTVGLVNGGSIGLIAGVFNSSTFNISDGNIGYGADAFDTSTINISGGSLDNGAAIAFNNSTITISNGSTGLGVDSYNTSTFNLRGGSIGGNVNAFDSSTFNVSGGSIDGDYFASGNSTLNFFGTGISGLLTDPDVLGLSEYTLSGTLTDGTSLSGHYLYLTNGSTAHTNILPLAVPEPGSLALLIGLTTTGAGFLSRKRKQARRII